MNVPTQSIVKIIISLLILLLIGLLFIYPSVRRAAELDNEIEQMQTRIDKQELLFPIYIDLLQKIKGKHSDILPFPEKATLDQAEIGTISERLRDKVREAGMESLSIAPDPRSLAGKDGGLLVNCVLKGDFFDFRRLMISLGEVASLKHIEEIRIQEIVGGREFRLRLWFMLGGEQEQTEKEA